jgi:hypothetical protein
MKNSDQGKAINLGQAMGRSELKGEKKLQEEDWEGEQNRKADSSVEKHDNSIAKNDTEVKKEGDDEPVN